MWRFRKKWHDRLYSVTVWPQRRGRLDGHPWRRHLAEYDLTPDAKGDIYPHIWIPQPGSRVVLTYRSKDEYRFQETKVAEFIYQQPLWLRRIRVPS